MQVSIIIPALNEADAIGAAIQSAWAAGGSQVIVVDGGSRDDTCQIAQRCRCELLQSEAGRAVQQNAGARRARGDVLLFQHADSRLAAESVSQITAALADPKVLSGGFRQRIEADGFLYRALEWGNAWRVRRLGLAYGDQGIFVRRRTFFDVGGFARVSLMEDLLLMRALRRRRRPVLLAGPITVNPRRWQRYGVVRQTLRNWSLCAAFRLGVSPERLARYYPRHDADYAAPASSQGEPKPLSAPPDQATPSL